MNERRRRLLGLLGTVLGGGLAGCIGNDREPPEASPGDPADDATPTSSGTATPTEGATPTSSGTARVRPSLTASPSVTASVGWRAKLGPGVETALAEASNGGDRIPVLVVASSEVRLESIEDAVVNAGGGEIRVLRSIPGVGARLTPAAIRSLAERSDVSRIGYDRRVSKN